MYQIPGQTKIETIPEIAVIKEVGLGQETFDVEIETTDAFRIRRESNVVRLAVTSGGTLLISPNGGGPARVISPFGYTSARVVKREVLQ